MVIFTGRVSALAKARGSLGTHSAQWARPGLSILVFLLSVLLLPGCNSAGIPTEASNTDPDTLDETVLSLSGDEVITPAGVDDKSPSLNFEASRVFCCNPLAYAFAVVHPAGTPDATFLRAATFTWDFGDGRTSTGSPVEHTYAWSGKYTVTLTGRSPGGVERKAVKTFSLLSGSDPVAVGSTPPDTSTDVPDQDPETIEPSGQALIADAGQDQTVTAGTTVTLNGSATGGDGTSSFTYHWSQDAGPSVLLADAATESATFVAPTLTEATTVVFTLKVAQGSESDFDEIIVRVEPDASEPAPATDAQLLAWLAELDPLPKVHYSWPVPQERLLASDPLLREYVRITHAIGIFGLWNSAELIDKAVALCAEFDDADASTPTTIAVNYSPWHWWWPEDLPPTHTGVEQDTEIQNYREAMNRIKTWVADANAKYGSNVAVSTMLLDSERFLVRDVDEPDAATWNAAIDAKYNAIYAVSKEVFPEANVEWYNRARARWHFTGSELGDGYTTSMYSLPFLEETRRLYRLALDWVQQRGGRDVMPWIALACGYRLDKEGAPWEFDWNYDPQISWQIGAELNDPFYGDHPDEYAPWHFATHVIFYPRPFDERVPHWGDHFVAYVRGAHGIDELP